MLIPGLTAAFLVGSMGRRKADPFADIDVVLVYRTAAVKEAARHGWVALAEEMLPYVAAIVHRPADNPDHLIAVYANGAKFDLYFATQEELSPHPHYQSIRILRDSGGWAQELTTRSAALSLVERPTMSDQELAELDRQFWAGFWEVYRLTRRGEVDRPFPEYIKLMANVIVPLLAVLPADSEVAQALAAAKFSRQSERNLAMLPQLFTAYQNGRAAVVERLQLSFRPHEAVERELQRQFS